MSEVYLGSVFVKCEPVCCMLTGFLFLDSTADLASLVQKVRLGTFVPWQTEHQSEENTEERAKTVG